jgi:non-specific serine/threonine protein kinase/serine/threonine-protein kinase
MTEDAVARLYRAALAHEPTERPGFLERACGGDATLRAAVEGLLAAGGATQTTAPLPGTSGSPARELAGRRIGPYRVLGLIGHGGMGAVYRAFRDDAYEKVVALKLLRAGLEGEAARARFETERRLLARLEHAYIARLYDGGTTEDGSPYLVMEFVDGGLPIQRYCAEHGLDVRARVELFLKACEAVAYAHRSLVVHRDLKPANLLVAADGTPKLLDFGIAKLLPEPGLGAEDVPTATVLQALTPDYASPEQVRGEAVTVTTDVYSLGVMLYELLAGRRPYQVGRLDPREIARVVCEVEPPRPSDVARVPPTLPAGASAPPMVPVPAARLDGDLDAIVMKALRKEPARRYPSVPELADDLTRYLERRPVLARPDTFAYRAGKFLRRRRGLVTAAAVVAVTIAAGVAATLQQARRAESHRQRAERRFGEVRTLANALLFDIYGTVETLAGGTPAREQIVKHGLKYLDTLAAEAEGDPGLQQELAAAYQRLGDVQGYPYSANLGDLDGALASYGKAVALLQELVRAQPADGKLKRALLVSHERLGDTLRGAGRTSEALEHARTSRALCEPWLAEAPDDPGRQRTCFISRLKLAELLLVSGDRAGARGLFEEARAIPQRLQASEPNARRDLTVVENKLGDIALAEGDAAGALARYRASLDIRQETLAGQPHDGQARRDVSVALGKVSDAQSALGDLAGAVASQRAALGHDEALAAADPANVEARFDVAWSLGALAGLLARSGQPRPALAHVERGLGLLEPLARKESANVEIRLELAKLRYQLGALKAATGDVPAARSAFDQAQSEARALLAAAPGDEETRATLAERCSEARAQVARAGAPRGAGEIAPCVAR